MTVFDDMYQGTPPWEIGRPQQAVRELLESGALQGRVLDVGCGTGDNALFLASHGLDVIGVDITERAIDKAKDKASSVEHPPRFFVADALQLGRLNTTFDTVLDCGFMHMLNDEGRAVYLRSLAQVMPPGALLHVICLSEQEPNWGGPHRFKKEELETLGHGFFVEEIVPVRFENTMSAEGAHAWRATFSFGGQGPDTLQ